MSRCCCSGFNLREFARPTSRDRCAFRALAEIGLAVAYGQAAQLAAAYAHSNFKAFDLARALGVIP